MRIHSIIRDVRLLRVYCPRNLMMKPLVIVTESQNPRFPEHKLNPATLHLPTTYISADITYQHLNALKIPLTCVRIISTQIL